MIKLNRNRIKCILLVLMIIMHLTGNSQSISSSVVSCAGGYYSGVNGNLSFTVAEMTMVQPFISSTCLLLQGFQQPQDNSVGIEELMGRNLQMFPNPVSNILFLKYYGAENLTVTISIYDITGKLLKNSELNFNQNKINQIDFSDVAPGLYIAEILFAGKNEIKKHTSKIQVIN
jgi:hypothetical protein